MFVYEQSGCRFETSCCHLIFICCTCFSKEFLGVQANIEIRFTHKLAHDMIITYSQMHPTYNYTQLSSVIWSLRPNGSVILYEVSGCGFESIYNNLIFRNRGYFQQGVPWDSGKYRKWIHSEMRTWHDINRRSNAPYIQVLTTQLSHLVSLVK